MRLLSGKDLFCLYIEKGLLDFSQNLKYGYLYLATNGNMITVHDWALHFLVNMSWQNQSGFGNNLFWPLFWRTSCQI